MLGVSLTISFEVCKAITGKGLANDPKEALVGKQPNIGLSFYFLIKFSSFSLYC